MRTVLPLAAALTALVMLASCGRDAVTGQAPKATATPAASASSKGLPDDVPVYPRAQVTMVVHSDAGNQVMATSSDTIEQVAGFYAKEMATKAGCSSSHRNHVLDHPRQSQ